MSAKKVTKKQVRDRSRCRHVARKPVKNTSSSGSSRRTKTQARPKTKTQPKQSQSDRLFDTHHPEHQAIVDAAHDYVKCRNHRITVQRPEIETKKKLMELMHKNNLTEFKGDDVLVKLTSAKENVKVKMLSDDDGDDVQVETNDDSEGEAG